MFPRVKEIREYEGLTQREVAQYLEIERSTYAGYENGRDTISLMHLNDLANLYHTSINYLVGLTNKKEYYSDKQEIDINTVCKFIKEIRKNKHLTQEELGKCLHTTQPNIHKYESGKSLISIWYAIELSKQFDCTVDELVGRH